MMALRSFQETNARLLRIKCTMQVCTVACGNTEVIASGKPLSPSTTAIRISLRPRVLSSFITLSQNLAPSLCSIQSPSTSLSPIRIERQRHVNGLVLDQTLVADFDPQRVEEDHWIDRIERPVLPLADLIEHGVGHPADQVRRHLGAVEFEQVTLNFAHSHAAGVEAQNLVIEAVEVGLAFGNQLRLERPGAVARNRNLDLAVLGQDGLRAGAVTAVAASAAGRIALLIAEMFGQFRPERPLDQRLLELLEQPIVAGQVFRLLIVSKQLIKQFRCDRRIGRHVSLLSKVNSQKPPYTVFLTASASPLDYTTISAPLPGRTGIRLVDQG